VEGGGSAGATHGEESEDASEARFTLKYLGSTLVETPSSEEATAEAIKTVITMVRILIYSLDFIYCSQKRAVFCYEIVLLDLPFTMFSLDTLLP